MFASEETAMLKLATYVWVIVFVALFFGVSIAAAGYYYYVVPHSTHLRILYTHSSQMVNEVATDFETWYKENYGSPIEVATTLVNPQTAYQKAATTYRDPEAEIWWGGPLSLFEKAYGGLLKYNSTLKSEVQQRQAMYGDKINFCPLMDLDHNTTSWYAASLNGIGVMYNERTLKMLNLSVPQNWTDLLEEDYERTLTMVAPSDSEVTSPFIALILQNENWTFGWEYLVRLSAFVKVYDNNEMDSALKVASSYRPLTILPDFYAYDKMTDYSNVNFTYLDATLLQPDPIAIFKKGTYRSEAKAFIDYVLTQRAQNVVGEYLLPVRQEISVASPRINPFNSNFPFIQGYNETCSEIGSKMFKDYYQAWITERHEQIRDVWTEIKHADKTSHYYALAWNNFTYAGRYMNRSEVDVLYNQTDGWTENVAEYIVEWQIASMNAYQYALTGSTYQYTLTVNIVGSGSVTKNPDQTAYTYGTVVQLTAIPDLNWTFSHWSGDLSGSTSPDSIIMDDDKTVTAHFTEVSTLTRVLLMTNMGNITIELYDDMPITTGNFINLVQQGVYDGTIFHRVIDGFMIQGGDPTGTGYGDPSIPTIPDEFTDHNHNNRGTIAMANTGEPNSGSSQFFINLVDNNDLDSGYPVFGKVIEGMDVVDSIGKVATDENDRPLQDVIILQAKIIS